MPIGDLNESPLHAALKRAVAPPGARFEVSIAGYVIDAVHDDLLIEVQTGNVGALKPKLQRLLPLHRLRLVVPVPAQRTIVRRDADGSERSRRRSPRRADALDALAALVGIPTLVTHPNLEVEVALVHDEETREHQPGRAWRRRGWVTVERRLLSIEQRTVVPNVAAWRPLLPARLPERFTTLDLAGSRSAARRRVAQRAAFVLREAGAIATDGHVGRAHAYRWVSAGAPSAGSPNGAAAREHCTTGTGTV